LDRLADVFQDYSVKVGRVPLTDFTGHARR